MAFILLADDDELIVDVVRAALNANGHVVGAVDDGKSVVAIVEAKQPDLVILDCSMPEVSGIQALVAMRRSDRCCRIPVLMLTARLGEGDEDIAIRAGAQDYLRKPFDPEQLVSRVEMLIDRTARVARLADNPGSANRPRSREALGWGQRA
ncbi:MAG: response regulator transcription factor [Sphingomicrobium sp.]